MDGACVRACDTHSTQPTLVFLLHVSVVISTWRRAGRLVKFLGLGGHAMPWSPPGVMVVMMLQSWMVLADSGHDKGIATSYWYPDVQSKPPIHF